MKTAPNRIEHIRYGVERQLNGASTPNNPPSKVDAYN